MSKTNYKRIILLCAIVLSCITEIHAQETMSEQYVYKCTYNAEGKIVKTNAHANKILVCIVCLYGCSASYTFYNEMIGMWDANTMDFNYSGKNNGWYIFRCNIPMMGTNFLYVYQDYSRVRVAMSFDNGKYHEYRKFVTGEDINMNPTR